MPPSTPKQGIRGLEILSLNMILLLGLLIQAYLYCGYCRNRSGLTPIFLSAFILGAVLIAYTLLRAHYKADVRNHILSCIFVLSMGPTGTFVALACNTFNLLFTRSFKGNFSDWIFKRSFSAGLHEKNSDRIYNRIVSGQETLRDMIDTEPLVDIMEFGTVGQKQEALVKVVKYFQPTLAPLLKTGLNDSNNAIRVQTAAALAKLRDDFHKEYMFYAQKIRDGAACVEEFIRFSKICEEYSNSSLMNAAGNNDVIRESIMLIERGIEHSPDNLELKISLARMYMVSGDTGTVDKLLTALLPQVHNPKSAAAETILELLFKMNRFAEMRRYAGAWKLQKENNDDVTVNEMLDFWSGNQVLNLKGTSMGKIGI